MPPPERNSKTMRCPRCMNSRIHHEHAELNPADIKCKCYSCDTVWVKKYKTGKIEILSISKIAGTSARNIGRVDAIA